MTAFTGTDLSVELVDVSLLVEGKKGSVTLRFDLKSKGETIGTGAKTMVLSGLRAYEESIKNAIVDDYNILRSA